MIGNDPVALIFFRQQIDKKLDNKTPKTPLSVNEPIGTNVDNTQIRAIQYKNRKNKNRLLI